MNRPPRNHYEKAVRWIAAEDEPGDLNVTRVSESTSVALVADVFGRTPRQVAEAVVRRRRRYA